MGEITRLCSLLSTSARHSRHRREGDDDDDDEEEDWGGDGDGDGGGLWVLPLHGALSGQEQGLVFKTSLPRGKTKVGGRA